MFNNIDFPKNRFYSQDEDIYNPYRFFIDALSNSIRLDLLLGYFTLTSINVLSYGFANFIKNGGTMRIVLNEFVKVTDIDVILQGEEGGVGGFDLSLYDDLESLKKVLSKPDIHFFECIAWLIASNRIEFQFIKLKGAGIPHNKDGIFYDTDKKRVGFTGSCNFTGSGIVNNLERVNVILDWDHEISIIQNNTLENSFNKYFEKKSDQVEYLDVKKVKENIQKTFGNKDFEKILEDEIELLSDLEKKITQYKIIEEKQNILGEHNSEPVFPFNSKPRQYQIDAYDNWVKNNYQGIFAMATGTGKTITSLNCILEEYKKNKFYRFIVLVPTISLAEQWEEEITEGFNFQNLISCNSLNKWELNFKQLGRAFKYGLDNNFCIIATYATFRSKKFQNIFNNLPDNYMSDMILIADEAHTFGSSSLTRLMPEKILKRIGLSATPNRQFDLIGNSKISSYFNSYEPNFTFVYNMKKAIASNVLCKYFYFPKFVNLSPDELKEYVIISKELMKFFDFSKGKYKDSPYVNLKLVERKNILHKAVSKTNCLINIIQEIGVEKFKNAFIYVPEGYEPNYSETDIDHLDLNDEKLIQLYAKLLHDTFKIKLRTFTGETKDRKEILNQFKDGKLDALLAMKCLDEGVDIPQTQYAIFCSSSGNPRQYIQRRGRVLRNYKGKEHAFLYDMIVMPELDPTINDPLLIKIEKNIFISELKRVLNFVILSENKIECLKMLEPICNDIDINVYDLANQEDENYN